MREKDVVHVHPHTTFETRQDLKQLVANIAAKLHRVTRIYKQNVVCLKRGKETEVDLLDAPGDQLDSQTRTVQSLRKRFNTRQPAALIRSERFTCNARRVAAANLDNAPRLQLANQRIIDNGIKAAEIIILNLALAQFTSVGLELMQQSQLLVPTKIDCGKLAPPLDLFRSDSAEIGEGFVVVNRADVITPTIRKLRLFLDQEQGVSRRTRGHAS